MDSSTNQPHMIMVTEEDLLIQLFIVVEQIPQTEVSHFFKGTYILLSLHYISDMECNPRLRDLYLFFEDKLLGLTTPSCKKTATNSGVTSCSYWMLYH